MKKFVLVLAMTFILVACSVDVDDKTSEGEVLYEGPTGDSMTLEVKELYLPFGGEWRLCMWVTNNPSNSGASTAGLYCEKTTYNPGSAG